MEKQAQSPLTPDQAEDLMKWVIGETRAVLDKILKKEGHDAHAGRDDEYTIYPKFAPDAAYAARGMGYCGHAQSFRGWSRLAHLIGCANEHKAL